ncbi:hypothetical protein K2173_004740 [Erythroxylum novogranatense]|uniref:CUE domain-containing protein n=1 Tax=Erythroxylum novogranatense TaxID=1862640 RepID=A0AAV8UD22_9ROSI|nr:hypothetical protein K2173_004740 [Erythroxylum novogranatense]
MGFNTVYQSLMEVFPQVDSRLLRAVAIEHPKDPHTAVEIVLSDVLPRLSGHFLVSSSSQVMEEQANVLTPHQVTPERPVDIPSEEMLLTKENTCNVGSASGIDSDKSHLTSSGYSSDSTYQFNCQISSVSSNDSNAASHQLQENSENEELILLVNPKLQEENVQSCSSQTSKIMLNALGHKDITSSCQIWSETKCEPSTSLGQVQSVFITTRNDEIPQVNSAGLIQENNGSNESLTTDNLAKNSECQIDSGPVFCGKWPQGESHLDATTLEMENSVYTRHAADDVLDTEFSSCSNKSAKSDQEMKINFLEDIFESASNNKKTLFSVMESVMFMMRQVELQEQAAEKAKVEASRGGLDTLVKVEELKQLLVHAKETNDMHAGEIYGERAILGTEMKELQARLLLLSEERDRALAILDEIHESLKTRLAAAEELRLASEQEKLEKEEAARIGLAEQEAIMEKVVEESKILQEEADANSKLRDFLVERGRTVDALQGEISVICQDVRLLKEKFDERVPLSKSISSSQTSCILASSGSSHRSMSRSRVTAPIVETSERPEEANPASSVDGESPHFRFDEDNANAIVKDSLDEEGWEIFEVGM